MEKDTDYEWLIESKLSLKGLGILILGFILGFIIRGNF